MSPIVNKAPLPSPKMLSTGSSFIEDNTIELMSCIIDSVIVDKAFCLIFMIPFSGLVGMNIVFTSTILLDDASAISPATFTETSRPLSSIVSTILLAAYDTSIIDLNVDTSLELVDTFFTADTTEDAILAILFLLDSEIVEPVF